MFGLCLCHRTKKMIRHFSRLRFLVNNACAS
jgi:hypothetical protein